MERSNKMHADSTTGKPDDKPNEMIDLNRIVLEHQLEEWRYLNSYVNEMDLGYQKQMTLITAIFSIVIALVTSSANDKALDIILVIPPGIIASMAYLSYQFRITAILRGHLAALENKMNRTLKQNVHMWNSALVEVYMAHNNKINQFMMFPMLFLMAIIMIISINYTQKLNMSRILLIIYWGINFVFTFIVFCPFLKNEKIRHEAEKEKEVYKQYKKYKKYKNSLKNEEKSNK